MTLHNIVILIREDPPSLPSNIQEPEFQNRLQRAQILFQPRGVQPEGNFNLRNVVIGSFF
jgi:hypothetical protein